MIYKSSVKRLILLLLFWIWTFWRYAYRKKEKKNKCIHQKLIFPVWALAYSGGGGARDALNFVKKVEKGKKHFFL